MPDTAAHPSLILLGTTEEQPLADMLRGLGYSVVHAPTGAITADWARELRPNLVILDATLPDMTGTDACVLLRTDERFDRMVPLLLAVSDAMSAEDRDAALKVGIWGFVSAAGDADELGLTIKTLMRARAHVDSARAENWIDPVTGLHSRLGLARRVRELGALMSRLHGSLACVVFVIDGEPESASSAGREVARTARTSDIVGMMSPTELVMLAPGADRVGAVELAERVGNAIRGAITPKGRRLNDSAVMIGYEAVHNFKYSPLDPVVLLTRAMAAVRRGTPVAGHPWMRHFDSAKTPDTSGLQPQAVPVPINLRDRRKGP